MASKKALLLIASPKTNNGASNNLGSYFLNILLENGFDIDSVNVNVAIRNNCIHDLVQKVNSSDILIISTPLYVDSIPAPLITFLENYKDNNVLKNKKLIAIVNSGFPESSQNIYAVEILNHFAKNNGFTWLGGYTIGGGGLFSRGDLNKNKSAINIIRSFHEAALMVKQDRPIPQSVFELASKLLMPVRMYTFFGQLGWIIASLKHRSTHKLWAKPYNQI